MTSSTSSTAQSSVTSDPETLDSEILVPVTSAPVGEDSIALMPTPPRWPEEADHSDREETNQTDQKTDQKETVALPVPEPIAPMTQKSQALPESRAEQPDNGSILGGSTLERASGADLAPVSPEPHTRNRPFAAIPLLNILPKTLDWKRWQDWSLRLKATAVVLVLVLGSVASLGMAATFFAGRSLETKIKELEQDTTQAIADKVAFFLKERYGDIQALANTDFLRNPTLLSGKLRTPDQEADKLDQFLQAYGVYDSISVYDREGKFRLQSQSRGTSLENIRPQGEQAYFQEVLTTGKPYISQPFVPEDSKAGKYSIFFAAPIRDKGQIVGVVRARMPVRYMSDVLASQQQQTLEGGGLTLYLVDQQGIIFASSSSAETVGSDEAALQAEELVPGLGQMQLQGGIQTEALGRSLISYVPLTQVGQAFQGELPDLGWGTLATIDQRDAFVPLANLRNTLIVGTLAIMVVIALLVIGTVNRLLEPLEAATRTVNRIGDGDLKARLAVQGTDEMAQLGRTINNMAGQIERLLQEQAIAAQEAQFLAEIANYSVTTANDLTPLFNQALGRVKQMLEVDRIALYQVAPGEPVLLAEATQGQTLANSAVALPTLERDRLARYRQGEPWVVSNLMIAEVDPIYYRWLNQLQVKAMVDMPLAGGDDRLIVLMVHDCRTHRSWEPQQIDFLRELANRLATAISRVNFLEQIAVARQRAETLAAEQTALKEGLQQRALELLMEVDPVSQGDLTIRARVTEDEIGTVADSYNATIESLSTIVAQVQKAAEQVSITVRSSESAVGNLSTGASTQTTELAAALQRIEDMTKSIEEVANNAQAAEVAVQQASQTVQEGDQAMNRTVDGILAIRETVGETAKKVKRLGESSQRISKVVNLISTFAAQTNLLALNASIEAARAGEEGRGFAVVADEVRSLARQSAEATAEIEKLVTGIQAETQEVVAAMEAGTEQVVMGTQLVDATRQSLNRIADTSQEISRLVGAIATAAGQQSTVSESVTDSMTGLATIAQQTSTEAEQLAAFFQQLSTVAQTLQGEIARFKI